MAGEILDALVLAARYDEQGLAASGRRVISQVEEVSRASARAVNATGQANPFSGVSRDLIAATRAFQGGTLSLEGYNVALQQARSELRAFADQGLQPAKRQIAAVNAAIDQTTVSLARQDAATAKVNPGMRRFASSLAVTAASSIGVSSAVGSAAQSVLFMSLGMGQALAPIAALSAAVLIANKAWDVFTKGQREAAEAAKHNTDALKHLQEQQRGPVAAAQTSFDAQRKEVERLSRDLADLARQRQAAAAGLGGGRGDVSAAREINLRERQVALTKELTDASGLLAVAARSVAEAQADQVQRGNELVRSLALEAGTFGLTASEARRVAVAMDSELTPSQRAAALASLNHLIQLERQKKAHDEAAAAARRQAEENLALQRSERIAAAGGGNLTQGAGGTAAGPFTGGLLSSATTDEMAESRGRVARATLDAADAAREWALEEAAALRASEKAFEAERVEAMVRAVDDLGFALLSVVDSLGLVDAKSQQVLQSFVSLSSAIARGDIAGAIAGGAGLIGSLTGPTAREQEHNRLIAQNSDRLAQLKLSLDAANLGAGGLARSQGIIGSVFDNPAVRDAGGAIDVATRALIDAAGGAGLSLTQFAKLVEQQTGIKILDEEGELVGKAFRQAREAVDAMSKAALTFSESLDAQAQVREVEDKLGIGGRSTDAGIAAVQRARDSLIEGLELDPATGARIKALDLSTIEGREAFLEFERDLLRRAKQGGLSKEELGKFENVDELTGALGEGADAVHALSDAANQATKSLSNVPDTFKLPQAEFAARAVDIVPTRVPLPGLQGTDLLPGIPGTTANSPTTQITGNTIVIQLPMLPKNATVQDQARAVADELEQRRMGTEGLGLAP